MSRSKSAVPATLISRLFGKNRRNQAAQPQAATKRHSFCEPLESRILFTTLFVSPTGTLDATHFHDVQAAINAAPSGTATAPTIINVAAGTYKAEQVKITKSFIDLVGAGSSTTTIEWNLNANSVVGGVAVGTSGSASVVLSGNGFTATGITFANQTPQPAPGAATVQAVAFLAQGDEEAFANCSFIGFQDTLYVKSGRSYFTNCFINGTVDFIFGNGTAFFNSCTINCAGNSGGCTVTAPNTTPQTAVGFVFNSCTITGNPTPTSQGGNAGWQSGIPAGSAYLGRAWQYTTSNASATFINTKMSTVINSAGWKLWDSAEKPTKASPRFGEFHSENSSGGTLSVSDRVSWSSQLVASGNSNKLLDANNYTVANVFGPESFWGAYTGTFALGGTWNPTTQISRA